MEYTKGQWVTNGDAIYSESEESKSIAYVLDNRSDDEKQANANLIAAAPDMYEALKRIADWIIGGDNPNLGDLENSGTLQALAKAEGK